MTKDLKILIVEDTDSDAFFLQRILGKGGYKITCEVVCTPDAMRAALQNKNNWDVITSDHSMPIFSAPEALALAKELCPDIPFIILSGEIDINLAVSLMKGGAQDYIQKKEMELIIPAIERALEDVELRKNQKRMKAELAEIQNRFKEVLENSQVASYKRNLITNNYDYFSPVIFQILGYTPNEMNAFSLEDISSFFHPDDLEETNRLIKASLSEKEGTHTTFEYRFKHKSGQYVWLEDKFTVMRDDDGTAIALIGSISDVTYRKKMETEIQVEKLTLEMAQQIARIGSWEWDMLQNKVEWSNEMYRIYDIDPDTFDGKPDSLLKLVHPDDLDRFKKSMGDNLSSGISSSLDYRIIHKDGSIHTLHAVGKVEFDKNEKPFRSVGTVQDITERKKNEESLRESEEKYKKLHETAGVGIGYYSPDGIVISYNNMAATHMGGNPEDFAGRSVHDIFPKADADVYMGRIQKAVSTEKSQVYEDKVDLPGEPKWFLSTFTRILDASGHVLGIQIVSSDISKQKREEELLRESEAIFRTMFEGSFIGISIVGVDGRFTRINQALCTILGYSREELFNMTFTDITMKEDIEKGNDYFKKLLTGELKTCNFEKRYVRKDGSVIWVDLSISAFLENDQKQKLMITFTQDITQRKNAEKELIASHSQIERILNNLQDAYFQADLSGKFTIVNPAAVRMYGYESMDMMLGMMAADLYADKHDRERLIRELQINGSIIDFSAKGLRKDGSTFWASINVQFVKDESGNIIGTKGAVRDVTDRKQAEKALRSSELRYKTIYNSVPVSIWVEDFSKVYDLLEDLRKSGVKDLRKYMDEHPDFGISAAKLVIVKDVNKATLKAFNVNSKTELLGPIDAYFPKEAKNPFQGELLAIWENKPFYKEDFVQQQKNGDTTIVELIVNFPDTREGYSSVLVNKTDITERKKAEEALVNAQALTDAIINSTPDLIWSVDPESFGLLMFNSGLRDYFKQKREMEIEIGMTPEDLFPPGEFVTKWREFYEQTLNHGFYSVEYSTFTGALTLQLTFNLLKRNNRVFGISVFGRDITEQKETWLII
jgi:PAS domain S-box-containing protein